MLGNNLSEISTEAFCKEMRLKDAANLFPTQKTQNMLGFPTTTTTTTKGRFQKGRRSQEQKL